MAIAVAVALVAAGLAHPEDAATQVIRIAEADRCPTAGWSVQDALVFGSEAEIGLRMPAKGIYSRPDGGVALYYLPGRVHLFARDGRLEHSFGRRGQGPGEFANVQIIRFVGDGRIETYDGPNARATVFGPPPRFEVERTFPIPFAFTFAGTLFHRDGRVVTNANLGTPEAAGWPIHILRPDGTIDRSFGQEPRELRPRVSFPLRRSLAWSGASFDTIWSAHVRQYRIERWSLDARLVRAVEREVPWFRPWDRDVRLSPATPPSPRLEDIHELDSRFLAVLLARPTQNPGEGMERRGDEWTVTRVDKVERGRLEILDLDRRCVAGSFDIPGIPLRFLDDGRVAVYRESDETGLASITLIRVRRP